MITQKQFAKELKETVNRLMGEGYRAEIHSVEKTNTGTVHALVISNGGNNISPSFYIEELYSSYQQEKATIEEMAENIVEAYCHNITLYIKGKGLDVHLNDREWMKKRLFLQLINKDKNKRLLKDSIHMDFKELSLVLYAMASNGWDGICKARITRAMCKHFGWDKKDILSYALENTMRLFPYKEFPMYELLQKAADCTDIPDINIPEGKHELMILTNDRGINGATAAFYPGVLKEIAQNHDTSLFLLPSSIHEFIVLEDNGIYKPEELKDMVQEINISAVSPEDVLSDNIYYYGCSSGILSVFNNGKLEEVTMP